MNLRHAVRHEDTIQHINCLRHGNNPPTSSPAASDISMGGSDSDIPTTIGPVGALSIHGPALETDSQDQLYHSDPPNFNDVNTESILRGALGPEQLALLDSLNALESQIDKNHDEESYYSSSTDSSLDNSSDFGKRHQIQAICVGAASISCDQLGNGRTFSLSQCF
jgi:hypothetical protein